MLNKLVRTSVKAKLVVDFQRDACRGFGAYRLRREVVSAGKYIVET